MASTQAQTWLEIINERLNVDVDWMDPTFIRNLPFQPYDQTSNQLWMGIQLAHESNREILAQTARELKTHGWLAVYTKMGTLMCKENIDTIQGRVVVQTSPSQAHHTDQTIAHAREYAREFEQRGISRNRFCIKVPATAAGVIAMQQLSEEGIPVLGTAIFSVEQAIACSQAGCMYISPYFNETKSHQDPSLWPNVRDPAVQHPFAHRIYQMAHAYKQLDERTGKPQPLIKLAAFRHIREVIAAAELGCHSITVSAALLQELVDTKYDSSLDLGDHQSKPPASNFYPSLPAPSGRLRPLLASDPLGDAKVPFQAVDITVDYLDRNAVALEQALKRDSVAKQRLDDAIAMFVRAEEASKVLIESSIGTKPAL